MLDMSKFMDQKLHVKFVGGREVVGVLKGYDALLNLVLDDTKEFLAGDDEAPSADPYRAKSEKTRDLGLVVCRGTTVTVICPEDGTQEIDNPFLKDE